MLRVRFTRCPAVRQGGDRLCGAQRAAAVTGHPGVCRGVQAHPCRHAVVLYFHHTTALLAGDTIYVYISDCFYGVCCMLVR